MIEEIEIEIEKRRDQDHQEINVIEAEIEVEIGTIEIEKIRREKEKERGIDQIKERIRNLQNITLLHHLQDQNQILDLVLDLNLLEEK